MHQCPNCGWRPPEVAYQPRALPVIVRSRTIRMIAEEVAARRRDVLADEIMNVRSSSYRIAHARHEVMWRARQLLEADGSHRFSFPQIGAAFLGGMDHTSVLHGCRQHEKVIRAHIVERVAAENAESAILHRYRPTPQQLFDYDDAGRAEFVAA